MHTIPQYQPDFLTRHPLITETLDVVEKATEIFGLSLMQEKANHLPCAKVLYKTVANACTSARSMALTTQTPLLSTKEDCVQEISEAISEVTKLKIKLFENTRSEFTRGKADGLVNSLHLASASSLKVWSSEITAALARVNLRSVPDRC